MSGGNGNFNGHRERRPLEDVWVGVNGKRMFARCAVSPTRQGTLPVVLVHGWGVSSAYFIPAAERLGVDFDVYAPDLPGHGKSSAPEHAPDMPSLAQRLMDWMRAVGIERAVLVGQSLGCQIAVEAALQYPSCIERLVLIGMTPDPAHRSIHAQLPRLILSGLFERPALVPLLIRDYLRMGVWLLPELNVMLGDPIEAKLPRVTQPAMLVRGERDANAPQRWLDEAAALLGTGRVAVIPGWGHAVQYSTPERLVAAIRPFLREARA